MSSTSILRIASRAQQSTFFRPNALRSLNPRSSNAIYAVPALIATSGPASSFSTSSRNLADDGHHEESFEEFTARYADTCHCSIGLRARRLFAGRGLLSIFPQPEQPDQDRQLLMKAAGCIDMRRNLNKYRMFLNFRYVPMLPCVLGVLQAGAARRS